jgi:hypothetical protein
MKARRVAAQIGKRISAFAEFSHSDVKMSTESLRALPTNFRIHVSLAQAKKIKATIDWVKDQDRANKTPSIGGLDEEPFLSAIREFAKLFVRHLPRLHLLGNSLVRRFGISGRQGLRINCQCSTELTVSPWST